MFFPRNALIVLPLVLLSSGLFFYMVYLVIRALRKYLRSAEVRQEKSAVKRPLGETIKPLLISSCKTHKKSHPECQSTLPSRKK